MQVTLRLSLEGYLGHPHHGGNPKGEVWSRLSINMPKHRTPGAHGGHPVKTSFDAVIIGSGAGGAPVALELSKAGHRDPGAGEGALDMARKTSCMTRLQSCRRDFFVPFPEDDPHTVRRKPDGKATKSNAGWISQCVGGGTVHMSGFFFRFHPTDFKAWPFGYEALAPYYDVVERELGVSGDVSKNPFEPPRKGPFPYPPVATHPIAAWVDQAGKKLNMHPYPVPRAIITKSEGERSACVYCALCGSYGCEVNAKSSTAASLLPKAQATGRCEVRPKAMVRHIHAEGTRPSVVYIDEADQEHEVNAKVVVVACSAIESARLLLLSRSQKHPQGLGNNTGQVGKNLCFSTLGQLSAQLFYKDFSAVKTQQLKSPMPFVGRAVQDFYEEGGTFHLLWEHPNPIHAAERLLRDPDGGLVYGQALMERMQSHFVDSRSIEVECFSAWHPNEGCYISLDPEATDRFGLPAARITIARDPRDKAASQVLVDKARTLLEGLGAKNIRTLDVGGETLVLQHGTCRMGQDPSSSVTTPAGHLHEAQNIYVTDGGSLPSSGAVPSTMTIMANSFRIAKGLVQDLGRAR